MIWIGWKFESKYAALFGLVNIFRAKILPYLDWLIF